MSANQGLVGIAFFEATAFIILLILFLLYRRDHQGSYFRFWLTGWCCLTFSAMSEVWTVIGHPEMRLVPILAQAAALMLFLIAAVNGALGVERRIWSAIEGAATCSRSIVGR